MSWIVRLLVNAAALGFATWLLTGITLTSPTTEGKVLAIVVVALIFGILNALVKPVFTLITSPIVLLSLGLFLLVINACMLLLTSWVAGLVGLGWSVTGFWTALFGSIVVSVVGFLLGAVVPERDRRRKRRSRA